MNEQDAQVQAIESRFIIDFLLFSFVVLSKYTNVSILKQRYKCPSIYFGDIVEDWSRKT